MHGVHRVKGVPGGGIGRGPEACSRTQEQQSDGEVESHLVAVASAGRCGAVAVGRQFRAQGFEQLERGEVTRACVSGGHGEHVSLAVVARPACHLPPDAFRAHPRAPTPFPDLPSLAHPPGGPLDLSSPVRAKLGARVCAHRP